MTATCRFASRGFTLTELIILMIVLGIMAFTAVPRLSGIGSFDAKGLSDQLTAVLRFGQKAALVQGRAVIVDFTGATPTLAYTAGRVCAASGTPLAYPVSLRSRGPSTPEPTVAGGLPSRWICFDTMGKPYVSTLAALTSTATIAVGDAAPILIEPETGYVH